MYQYSIQTSLFYSIDYFLTVPIYKKYVAIFSNLALSAFQNVNTDVGATGFSRHAMIRALIIQTLENIPSIPQLIWFLANHPVLSDLCGFKHHDIPDETQFYRFLKYTRHSLFEDLLSTVNKILVNLNIIPLGKFIIDSKPVLANTKENNHKNPHRNLKDKNRKPKRNRSATLGYYSYQVDKQGNKTNIEFFWGYRNHAIIDANSGICLVEATLPNNRSDVQIAKTLIRKLKKKYHFKKGALFIGDAIYDTNAFYHFIIKQMKGKPVIPLNPRNTKNEIKLSKNGHRICAAGLEMYPNGLVKEQKRVRRKERCPIKMSKKIAQKYNNRCPCDHETFTSGKQYGCTAYIDIAGDLRASIQRDTEQYKKLRAKRMAIERYFSRLQMLDMEEAPYYSPRSIKNRNTITHLSLSLIALAAVKLGREKDMHRYRRFAA